MMGKNQRIGDEKTETREMVQLFYLIEAFLQKRSS